MSHIPRPWKVNLETGEIEGDIDGNPVILGRVYGTEDVPSWADADNYENEANANARLIAAAPDLLEACRAFVTAWEKSHQLEKTDVALRLAEQAIAKATGESEAPNA